MMNTGSFYTKMSDKVVPYLAAKLSHKRMNGKAKSSNYKRVVDDLKNQMTMMMRNNSGNKCRTWRKLGTPSSAVSTIFSVFGSTDNKANETGEVKTRFREVKAKNCMWSGGRVGVLRLFKKGDDDHRADSVGTTVKRSSNKITNVFRRVADSRKLRLVQSKGISARKLVKRERKGLELCKRRILMGVKCKPVNASGKLHYGRDGVILAEDQV